HERESAVSHWPRNEPLGLLPVLELPLDRPRKAVPIFRRAAHRFDLSKSLTAALQSLSERERATVFCIVLAALKAVIGRYTGQDDILVGGRLTGPGHCGTRERMDDRRDYVPLHTSLQGNPSFRDLVTRVQLAIEHAATNRDIPRDQGGHE